MKKKTIGDYFDEIDDEYVWRVAELRNFSMVIDKTKFQSGNKEVLLRAGITLIYAHWEGFIKSVCRIYLQYLNQQKCAPSKIIYNLLSYYAQQQTRSFPQTYNTSLFEQIVKTISNYNGKETIQFSTNIETKSNLKYNIFDNIMWSLGLDNSEFILQKELIDLKLVDNRNSIAHGKFCRVDVSEYLEVYNKMTDLMRKIKNNIQNAIELKKHLK